MKNKELKEEFISEISLEALGTELILTALFKRFGRFEEEWDKDCCNFTIHEIVTVYKMICSTSLASLSVRNGYLSRYTRFMMARSMVRDGQNHYEEIDDEILKGCLNIGKMDLSVVSREDLENAIIGMDNPGDQFVALAIFEGIGVSGVAMSEFYDLSMDNFEGNVVHLHGLDRQKNRIHRDLTVSDKLIRYAKEAAETYEYVLHRNEDSDENYYTTRKFDENDHKILKTQKNTKDFSIANERYLPAMRARVYNQVNRVAKELDHFILGTKELKESGRIDMIRRFMKEDGTSPRETIFNHKEEIAYRYKPFLSDNVKAYLQMYEKYLMD